MEFITTATAANTPPLRGGAWVSQAAPSGVAVDVLRASPSVKMDFHDAPANLHAAVARQYPTNWKPSAPEQKGGASGKHEEKVVKAPVVQRAQRLVRVTPNSARADSDYSHFMNRKTFPLRGI
jgi:hypothetical protein